MAQLHRSRVRGLAPLALLLALAACGDSKTAVEPSQPMETDLLAQGYTKVDDYLVPPITLPDATLPDSCPLLLEADPKGLIAEPLGPIERMSHVCIATAAAKPGYQHMLGLEIRHPEPGEVENSGGAVPKDLETYWMAEGNGVGFLGGKREDIQAVGGLGDFAVWYPITDGLCLHTYWKGKYIIRVTTRGLDNERGLPWAKTLTQRALDASAAFEKQASDKQG